MDRGRIDDGGDRGGAPRLAVRYSPSMTMSAKEGMQQISMPTGERNPREMATAFTAWFTAPAPTA